MDPLCGHKREAILEIESSLRAKNGDGANAGAVIAAFTMFEDMPQEIMILLHGAVTLWAVHPVGPCRRLLLFRLFSPVLRPWLC